MRHLPSCLIGKIFVVGVGQSGIQELGFLRLASFTKRNSHFLFGVIGIPARILKLSRVPPQIFKKVGVLPVAAKGFCQLANGRSRFVGSGKRPLRHQATSALFSKFWGGTPKKFFVLQGVPLIPKVIKMRIQSAGQPLSDTNGEH